MEAKQWAGELCVIWYEWDRFFSLIYVGFLIKLTQFEVAHHDHAGLSAPHKSHTTWFKTTLIELMRTKHFPWWRIKLSNMSLQSHWSTKKLMLEQVNNAQIPNVSSYISTVQPFMRHYHFNSICWCRVANQLSFCLYKACELFLMCH